MVVADGEVSKEDGEVSKEDGEVSKEWVAVNGMEEWAAVEWEWVEWE